MKYILICIFLFLILILALNVNYQEPLMQFEEITISPLTTFAKKEAVITFAPVPDVTHFSVDNISFSK
jgi:hypothetical protein